MVRRRDWLEAVAGERGDAKPREQLTGVYQASLRRGGYVVPDTFTHGTSAQRVRWFKRGIEAGELRQCNTFEARQL